MEKRNILVFPCGSEIGTEIYYALRYSRYFNLIGASSIDDHGKFVYEDYIGDLPFIDDSNFVKSMRNIIKERNIDALYPTSDIAIAGLKAYEKELGCIVIAPPLETTEICLSKNKTYERLKGIVSIPKVYKYDEVEDFPVFVKPNIGTGSKGASIIRNKDELISAAKGHSDVIILEYLPGREYTVDCFSNRQGELLYFAARIRNRIKAGTSVNTYFVENQGEFEEPINRINNVLKFDGAWFAQFKRDKDGKLCLLEIASRLGGSSVLSRAVGVNFPMLSLFDAFGYDVTVSPNEYGVELDRAFSSSIKYDISFNTVYVDYDDCLLLDEKFINSEMIAFLFNAINKGKRIVLLSKHDGDLSVELRSNRIIDLFDDIIHIRREEDKSKYIKEQDAIFIDDSFAEREMIKEKCKIPVFSPDMIGLLEI